MQTSKILSLAVLISLVLCWPPSPCEAQKKFSPADYDYYALAITSITEITGEASKLPDIPQRAKVLIEAAKVLQPAKKEESIRLLELVLRDLKEWGSADDASWQERNTAATLRNEALAVYALVDSEKALIRQKELQTLGEPTASNNSTAFLKSFSSWRAHFNDRQTAADQAAKVALSLIDTEPERALGLVGQSLRGATVSSVLFHMVEKLMHQGNRVLLNRVENNISQVLATNVTLDPSSVFSASTIGLVDKDMPQAAKNAFVSFMMRSVQTWAIVIKEPGIDNN